MCRYQNKFNTEKRGRGAPLLSGGTGKKARGVYLGGTEANCGNGASYFVYLTSNYTDLLSYLRDGSETNTATVRMNYCKPSEYLTIDQIESWTYQVTGSIVSTQEISNGLVVKYKAGTFVELNDGFISGTNFVAEIDPCVITQTIIAAKTDDIQDEPRQSNSSLVTNSTIKIYPSILSKGNAINIVTSAATQNLSITIYDLHGKVAQQATIYELYANEQNSLLLNNLSNALYFVKAYNNSISVTQKIIIQ